MAANIDPIALVIYGARKAAERAALFENNRNNIGPCQQLKCRG